VERLQSLLASISKPSGFGSLAITGKNICTPDHLLFVMLSLKMLGFLTMGLLII
jgi:hypothetical protein